MLRRSLNLEKEIMFYEPYPSYYMIGSILYLICIKHLFNTRKFGGPTAPLLSSTCGGLGDPSGTLRALQALHWLLSFSIWLHLGGLFSIIFLFECSLYLFWIFGNFRGSFLGLIFYSSKFRNWSYNQNGHFWGGSAF